MPSEKKIHLILASCKVIFPSPEEARKIRSMSKIFAPLYVKPSNKGFFIPLLFSVFSILSLVCELHLTAKSVAIA